MSSVTLLGEKNPDDVRVLSFKSFSYNSSKTDTGNLYKFLVSHHLWAIYKTVSRKHSNNGCPLQARPTWEELLGGGGDLGLLGDAVSMVGGAGATGCAEAGDFLHALGERGNLQSPQHIHWVWGGEAGEQTVIAIVTLIQTLITNPDGVWWDRDVHTAYRNTDIGSSAQKSLSRSFKA